MRRPRGIHGRSEHGAALVVALCMLIALLLLGASAARMALQGEKAARGDRDRYIAFQAAEEALMDAENDIEGPARSALFAPGSALGFVAGCGFGAASANLGLCLPADAADTPVWQQVDFSDVHDATVKSVPYGQFTGAGMATGQGFLPFKRPRYIIELVQYTHEGEDAGPQASHAYRITAIGFGTRENSQVVLQSYYRKLGSHAAAEAK